MNIRNYWIKINTYIIEIDLLENWKYYISINNPGHKTGVIS